MAEPIQNWIGADAKVLSRTDVTTQLLKLEAIQQVSANEFITNNRDFIESSLHSYGGVLLRGFETIESGLAHSADALLSAPMTYRDRATPRSVVSGSVMTSTNAPSSMHIRMHCESSFTDRWPAKILFQCVTPSAAGGCTPIADVRAVYQRIDADIREHFEDNGVTYLRHFGKGPGMDYREVFQVKDEQELRDYCQSTGISIERLDSNKLRLWQTRPAAAIHPVTHEPVWFNHACTLHVSLLEATLRDTFRAQYGNQQLPHNTYFGEGGDISDDVIREIYSAYEAETLRFDWHRGDLLLLDNMLMAHGRDPYEGEREIIVTMGDPLTWQDIDHSATVAFNATSIDSKAQAKQPIQSQIDDTDAVNQSILQIVRSVLEDDTIELADDFFDVGGDSISATKIVQEIDEQLSIEMPLDSLFDEEEIGHWLNTIA
ncbi:MAG: acyl carrier protein/alpha-ketoglutarate-dependent taurine dioxygenase [Limisphaerales bacterium]|jgi:acyl carrier protein/alpha-ketoglutarate-dependent taurine dioxygenase